MTQMKDILRGDDYAIELNFNSTDAFSIENWTITFTLKLAKEQPDSEAALRLTKTVDSILAPSKKVQLALLAEQTSTLLPGSYHFDIQLEMHGVVKTLLMGRIRVTSDVTHGTYG